jgi:hypothetical protein
LPHLEATNALISHFSTSPKIDSSLPNMAADLQLTKFQTFYFSFAAIIHFKLTNPMNIPKENSIYVLFLFSFLLMTNHNMKQEN